MKKLALLIALVGSVTLAHATSTTLFNNLSCNNNSYSCSMPTIGPNLEVSDLTFTFSTVNCGKTGTLSCDLENLGNTVLCGTQKGSTTTWTCTLSSSCINYLNNCISSGKGCNFNLSCLGFCNIGSCTCNYDCKPTPPKNVPDTSVTIAILGAALLGLEVFRRKFAPAAR